MQISSNSGGTPTTLAEINVTPLVDVMLVLLIVFMVSAPLMQQGIQVDLPKANAGTVNQTEDPITLVVSKNRRVTLSGNAIDPSQLLTKLSAIRSAKPEVQVLIQADQSVAYGFVAQVMAEVKKAKIHRVGLITSPDSKDTPFK